MRRLLAKEEVALSMRRIILLLAVAAMMTAMMVAMAAPAMAAASQFIQSPEGITLHRVAPAAQPQDPFQPGDPYVPTDPYLPQDPYSPQASLHCTQGSTPICPRPTIT